MGKKKIYRKQEKQDQLLTLRWKRLWKNASKSSKLQTSAALLQRAPNRQLLRTESVQIVWAVSKHRSASL
jgi:hypothetical protein